jgi:hypothetical protein
VASSYSEVERLRDHFELRRLVLDLEEREFELGEREQVFRERAKTYREKYGVEFNPPVKFNLGPVHDCGSKQRVGRS